MPGGPRLIIRAITGNVAFLDALSAYGKRDMQGHG